MDAGAVAYNYNVLRDKFDIGTYSNVLRILIIVLNISSVYLIVRRYHLLVKIHILQTGSIANGDSLSSTGLVYPMILEIILNFVFDPPYVAKDFDMNGTILVTYDYTSLFNTTLLMSQNETSGELIPSDGSKFISNLTSVKIQYEVSSILAVITLFRLYHFFRVLSTISYWNSLKAQSICKNFNCDADYFFGLKAYLKDQPFKSIAAAVVIIVLFFGLVVKLVEYYNKVLISSIGNLQNNLFAQTMSKFENVLNSLWLIVVTMSTIGYGDIYPTTYLGRTLAIFACICGTFLVSMLVVFLNKAMSFDEVENHVFEEILQGSRKLKDLEWDAGKMIFKALEYNFLRKRKIPSSGLYRFKILYVDLRFKASNFKRRRLMQNKKQLDVSETIGSLKFTFDNDVSSLKSGLEVFKKQNTVLTYINNLSKESEEISGEIYRNSFKVCNLLKILNNNLNLPKLNKIDEVYHSKVDIIEEVLYYHDMQKEKLHKIRSETSYEEEKSLNNRRSN